MAADEPNDPFLDRESRFSNLKPSKISALARGKYSDLHDIGGVEGLIAALETNKDDGIPGSDDDISTRKIFFATDSNPGSETAKVHAVYLCAWEAIKDPWIGILVMYILFSLGFGIKDYGIKALWPGRGAQLVEIVLLLIVTTMMNFWPMTLSYSDMAAYSPHVDVVRNKERMKILASELVVGDVVFLKPGDEVAADGIFADGRSLQLEKLKGRSGGPHQVDIDVDNPFIFSGNMVAGGYSRMVVTALRDHKPHQMKWMEGKHFDELGNLVSTLSFVGRYFAVFAFMCFLFGFSIDENLPEITRVGGDGKRSDISELSIAVVGILATCAIIALTNLEGLPLAVNGTLAYSMKILLNGEILIKEAALCHQVAAADNICFNSNGTITSDESEVKEFWIGSKGNEEVLGKPLSPGLLELLHQAIALNPKQHDPKLAPDNSLNTTHSDSKSTASTPDISLKPSSLFTPATDLISSTPPPSYLTPGILVNPIPPTSSSTPDIASSSTQPHSNSTPESIPSPAETAMFRWAIRKLGMFTGSDLISTWAILETEPFNPVSNRSGVMITKSNAIQVHRKGAADAILPLCSHYYEADGTSHGLNEEERGFLEKIVEGMEKKGLTCIAFAHKKAASAEEFRDSSRRELTLLGLVGFENIMRTGFKKFVKDCQTAEIKVRLLTRSSVSTAKFMAVKGGLMDKADTPFEGKDFRILSAEERMEIVDQIRVLADASPSDKLLMVEALKEKNHVVAYVGGGLGDAQAMKAADVGICFGTQGRAEILKACSDIVILSKSFDLVFNILKWGRGFYNSLDTYLKFSLIAVYVDLLAGFVTTLFPGGLTLFYAGSVISKGEIPTPVFQLLWVKLIFGTVAPLSLLTKDPPNDLMSKPGRAFNEPLMTREMHRNIITNISCQVLLLVAIHFMGASVLKLNPDEKNTAIFTTYILCQIFSLVNAKMHDKKNNPQDIHNNKCFWGIVVFITLLQVVTVEVWKCISTARLSSRQWATCILMSAASTLINFLPRALRYIYATSTKIKRD